MADNIHTLSVTNAQLDARLETVAALETAFTLTGTAIDPANGHVQSKSLSAGGAVTLTESLASGQCVRLILSSGQLALVTWPTMTWVTTGQLGAGMRSLDGTAYPPVLGALDVIELWKVGATLYGEHLRSISGNALVADSGPGPTGGPYDPETDTGFYGFVPAAQLITGDALATELALTAGVSQNSTAGWLKFYSHGKVLFVARQTLRHTISWDDINAVNAVDGTATVTIGIDTFNVRLLTGADADPSTFTFGTACSDNPGAGSEWNELLYRVHRDSPSCNKVTEGMSAESTTHHGGPQVGSNWASYSDAELNTGTGNGRASWCQEVDGVDGSRRVHRGLYGFAYFYTHPASHATTNFGWRPVLELV